MIHNFMSPFFGRTACLTYCRLWVRVACAAFITAVLWTRPGVRLSRVTIWRNTPPNFRNLAILKYCWPWKLALGKALKIWSNVGCKNCSELFSVFWAQIVHYLNKSSQFLSNDWGVSRSDLLLQFGNTNKIICQVTRILFASITLCKLPFLRVVGLIFHIVWDWTRLAWIAVDVRIITSGQLSDSEQLDKFKCIINRVFTANLLKLK